ncbi:hypothetical protein RDT67_18770 [Serratia fonticola]|uniref:Conjugal transfer protein TraS n=1 Tax=Serratia fonticola TaxID=47917 RepID=A0AAJ1YDK0_SERFO|nr:hypothetical protein [Serratia fonticola]MDQ9128463.1 hypothetical protein [Serratia fonticola]
MRISRNDLEADVEKIFLSLRNDNYMIPTNKEIFAPIIKMLVIIYVMQLSGIVADYIVNHGYAMGSYFSLGGLFDILLVNIFASAIVLVLFYPYASILPCINKQIRDSSTLLTMLKKKFDFFLRLLIATNVVVGVVMVIKGYQLVFFLGLSWFITFIIFNIVFNLSIGRYFTPAVVAGIDKIKSLLSPSSAASESRQ